MEFVFIILVLVTAVIAMAFWKDIKSMSDRENQSKKGKMKPAEEKVKSNQETRK